MTRNAMSDCIELRSAKSLFEWNNGQNFYFRK